MDEIDVCLDIQGKYEKADNYYQKALSLGEKIYSQDHPRVAEIMNEYAALLKKMGRTEEAKKLEAKAKQISR